MVINGKDLGPFLVGTAGKLFNYEPHPFFPHMDKEEAYPIIDAAWDMGLRAFDCAAGYGEPGLGQYLHDRNRTKEAFIMTKGCHPNPFRYRVTPYDLRSDLADSLVKLKADCIDLYMLHRDDPKVPVDVIMDTLAEVKKEGLIKAYGVSNWTTDRIAEANEYARKKGIDPLAASSPNFSLAHQVRDAWGGGVTITGKENEGARDYYRKNNLPVFAYSSLARGFFSGLFHSDEREKAAEILDGPAKEAYLCDENFEILRRTEELAKKYEVSVATIALAYIFSQDFPVIPILSGETVAQFQENVQNAQRRLTKEELVWLTDVDN